MKPLQNLLQVVCVIFLIVADYPVYAQTKSSIKRDKKFVHQIKAGTGFTSFRDKYKVMLNADAAAASKNLREFLSPEFYKSLNFSYKLVYKNSHFLHALWISSASSLYNPPINTLYG